MGPRRKRDPLEQEMGLALRPGRFIEYGSSWSFVSGLDGVAGKIGALAGQGEAERAVELYELFIAGCYEKAEEIDDSGGNFGMFVEDLFCGWIGARQSAGADRTETAEMLLTWMEDDDYGFCFQMERRAVDAFDRRGLAAFEKAVRNRFDSAGQPASGHERSRLGGEPEESREASYRRRRRSDMLKTIYARQRNVDAYLGVCGDELTPRDCEVVAEICRKRRRPEDALSWVERGIELESKRGPGSSSGWRLDETRRELLKRLGRGDEALESAWKEFRAHPSEHTYETLMRYVPQANRKEWRVRAMEASESGELGSLIGLWLKTKEIDRLVKCLRAAGRESLKNMSHYTTEPAAKRLEKLHPDVAARLYMALGLRIVDAKKSKYYDAAISHFEKAKRCCARAGLEDEWQTVVASVRRKHHRKYGFMPGFERVVEGRAKEREPTFLERARRRWPRRGRR